MKLFYLLSVIFSISGAMALMAESSLLKVGDPAPKISGQTQDERIWRMEDSLGKKYILLYFYPKDDTPGCTKQACTWRDRMSDLKNKEVEVIGVSFDSAQSHRDFIKKYDLNFSLLADTDGKIADAFGARREGGRNISRRVSFLIDKQGNIAHITDNPSADVHLNEIKNAIEKLAN